MDREQLMVTFGAAEVELLHQIEEYCKATGAKKATAVKAALKVALSRNPEPIAEAIVREIKRFRRPAASAGLRPAIPT